MSNKVLGRLMGQTNVFSAESAGFYRDVDESALEYAIESCCRDLNITLTLMASMESIRVEMDDYQGFLSMESYERRVDDLLESVGIYTPVATLVPSFEEAKESSDTVIGKIKKAGKAFWDAILRTFRRLKDFFLRLIGKSKEKEGELKEKGTPFARDLTSQGITHITNPKPTGDLVKTHAHSPSAVPGIFLDNKVWSKAKIDAIAADVNDALDKVTKASHEEIVNLKTSFDAKYKFGHGGDEKEWVASISDLEDAKKVCFKLLDRIREVFAPLGKELDTMISKAETLRGSNATEEELRHIKDSIARLHAAMDLYTVVSRIDSIGWVTIGIVNHAKVVK